jgi:Coenzyme PQQ synthesis protein D (PqqD)
MIPGDAVFRRKHDVRFRIIAPEAIVVRQSEPEVLVINEVGARVLERIDSGESMATLVAGLAEEYEVDPKKLETDVTAFIEDLAAGGVIESVGAPDAS